MKSNQKICRYFVIDRPSQLSQGTVVSLRDAGNISHDTPLFVVASHDCDLVNDKEEQLELIPALRVETMGGNYSHAKNARTLHIAFAKGGSDSCILQLDARQKFSVAKVEFPVKYQSRSELNLAPNDKAVFRSWLASRYSRAAFPDSFNQRLSAKVNGKSILAGLERLAKLHGKHVGGLFFELSETRFSELSESEPYRIRIFVVYEYQSMLEGGEESAAAMASGIKELFAEFDGNSPIGNIILLDCEPHNDLHFPLGKVKELDKFGFEYISAREGEDPDIYR